MSRTCKISTEVLCGDFINQPGSWSTVKLLGFTCWHNKKPFPQEIGLSSSVKGEQGEGRCIYEDQGSLQNSFDAPESLNLL